MQYICVYRVREVGACVCVTVCACVECVMYIYVCVCVCNLGVSRFVTHVNNKRAAIFFEASVSVSILSFQDNKPTSSYTVGEGGNHFSRDASASKKVKLAFPAEGKLLQRRAHLGLSSICSLRVG